MKKTFLFAVLMATYLLSVTSCKKEETDAPQPNQPQKGYAIGKVVDTKGQALAKADIVVNNTQYYNDNILGQTDSNGNYKLALTPGSWYVRGTIDVKYDNQTYTFDLHPENPDAFAGTEGAIRNLSWKLTGEKPTEFGGGGYYGGSIEVFGYGNFFDTEHVELTLEPVGSLVDGSTGVKIIKMPDSYLINDVPIGKYKIKARYAPENRSMQVRLRNKAQEFQSSVTGNFEPAYSGAKGSYKMNVEVTLP